MRISVLLVVGGLLGLLGGCAEVSQRVMGRFDTSPVKLRRYAGEMSAVHQAAQAAMRNIGYVLTETSLREGLVRGRSAVQPGDPTRGARQFELTVRLTELPDGQVEAGLVLAEQREDGLPGGAQRLVVREHSLYTTYFERLDRVLQEPPAGR